jgi:GT2 family glycosyltransferase
MNKIATLVPTYKRARKLPALIKNHDETSINSVLYFVITPDDLATRKVLKKLKQKYFIVDGEYVKAINYGIEHTTEEFVLNAADDVVFKMGWDKELLKLTGDWTKNIFGGIDSWNINKTLIHISHPMARRSYLETHPYFPEYTHYMCDIEFMQRGWKEDCVIITPKTLIEHPHPHNQANPQGRIDLTYKRSAKNLDHDKDLYDRRKGEFEVFDFDSLYQGIVVPTKLNPVYNQTLLSIVIPSWNDADYLIKCLNSIVSNTYYRFEIIIIDDHSPRLQRYSPWELVETKKLLNSFMLKDQSCSIRVIYNTSHKWINYNWNLGAGMAKGNYVAILNSDITLSKDWDKFLISALETPMKKSTIACPFQTNAIISKPYSLDLFTRTTMPNMICGPAFLFRQSDVKKLFPIPEQIRHWCGDNILADRAEKLKGVVFAKRAIIYHYGSQSSQRLPKGQYKKIIYRDLLTYEKLSGKSMKHLKRRFIKASL